MATCQECSIFLLSTDDCPQLELTYRSDLLESPSGCPGCRMLLRGVTSFIPELDHFFHIRPDGVKVRFWRPGQDNLLVADVEFFRDEGYLNDMSLEFYTLPDQPSPWPGFNAANHLPQNPSGSDRWSTIRHWLRQCATDHETCVSSQPSPLPSRVIKISPANIDTEPFVVSLYEPSNESVEYTCLSYCWGGKLPIRTTTSTLNLFKHGIAWSRLPKTFQDAIELTSILGIQYIWIDALCIVQDDELDWARESAKMAEIYSSSYLTIGAALAKDCHVGCFVLQDEQPGLRHEVRDQDPKGSPYSIYVRRTRHDEGPTIDSIEPPPSLLSRAWAFQERLLSPKVVFFAPQEMFYECNAASLCECSLGEAREHIDNVRDRLRDVMYNLEGDRQRLVEMWHELVGIYSSMKLTFQDDVLPAISGVAHRIQDWTDSRYYAGIWSHSIVEDLRWTSRRTQEPGSKKFLAPTWSWASTGGATKYDAYQGSRILADDLIPEVLDIGCTLRSTDPCGGVVAGHIIIRGLLLEAEMNPYPHSVASDDHRHLGVVTRKDYNLSDGILFRFVLDRDPIPPATNGVPSSTSISCLLFDVQRISQDAGSGYNAASALMLRLSPVGEGSYERIGYGQKGIEESFIMEKAQMRTVRII